MSARVMVGPELCAGWPAISLEYLSTVLKTPAAVRQNYPPWLYWTAKYFSPEVEAVLRVRKKAADFVEPVLRARHEDYKMNGRAAQKHDDFIQWLMDEHRSKGKKVTADELVQNIFITMVASMQYVRMPDALYFPAWHVYHGTFHDLEDLPTDLSHFNSGTSTMGYSVLLNLLAHPDALAEIKDEIQNIQKDELAGSPTWTRHALGELRLLDSFMRETLRVNPFTEGQNCRKTALMHLMVFVCRALTSMLLAVTMQRTVLVPYTFKDGLTIPLGLSVNFTARQHSLDEDIHGPHADMFDAYRWVKKRQGFDTSKFQFASTSDDWLNWGGGPHACPGRFLADVAIKLTMIYFITNYDMKYREGRTERPANGRRNLMIIPDMTVPIMCKQCQK